MPARPLFNGIDHEHDEPEPKRCLKCREVKPLSDFYRDTSRKDGLYPYCRECTRNNVLYYVDKRRVTKEGRERSRLWSWTAVLKTYGLTPEKYKVLLEEQDGVCAICRNPETFKNKDGLRPLCVDHDHASGKIRGLLCHSCNVALGHFGEDLGRMEKAMEYLRRHA
jgi:hypothetical protein